MGDLASDLAAVRSEGLDETMMEIGEWERPPGDPPYATRSWAERVVGGKTGGRPNPNQVVADAFVADRLHLEFPNGEDGEPVIMIEKEVLDKMNGLWKQCMIVKVLGRKVPIAVLTRKLRDLWRPQGEMHVVDLPYQFFMIRFEAEDEYLMALTGGPWKAFGSYLMVQAWSPDFEPTRDEIVTTPVWVRLANLPVNFCHRGILMGISSGLGKPLKVYLNTLNMDRARFARVCVEVNLKKPMKRSIMVNGERYYVTYEGLTALCSLCGLYGHEVHTCASRVHETSLLEKPANDTELVRGESSREGELMNDGFIPVRRPGKGPVQPRRMVFTARNPNELPKRKLPEASGRKENEYRNL